MPGLAANQQVTTVVQTLVILGARLATGARFPGGLGGDAGASSVA